MKRQISILACVLMLLAIVFAVASCSQPEAAHVHEYAEFVSKEATCTEKGEVTLTCACGDKYTNETAAKGHNLAPIAAVEPTCTTEGKTEGVQCTDCGLITVAQSTIAPIGHKLGAAATCTTAQTCELCDHVFVEALGHKANEATCTEASVCKVCGEEQAPALGHTPTEATCTEASVCTVCDEELAPALGHSAPAACYSGYCTVCYDAWIDATADHEYFYPCDAYCMNCCEYTNWEVGHNMEYHAAKESTCTENGNTEYWSCTYCNAVYDNGFATGIPSNMMNVKLPLAEHEYFYACDAHCMNCHELTNEAAAHSLVHVEAVAPTCTENGNVEYWACEFCGNAWNNAEATGVILTRRDAIVLAHGHKYENDCDKICYVCEEITREDAEHLLDHSDAVAPTCTKTGNIEFDTCEYCLLMWDANGDLITDPTIPANGHKYEVACDPVCLVCSFVNTEAAHDVVKVTKKAATCTVDGAKVDYWYCSYCELCWVDEACTLNTNMANVVIPALGHKGHDYDRKCDTCNLYVLPDEGEAFILGLYQPNKKANYYFTGSMSGYYFATTTNAYASSVVQMFIEETNGGFYLYFVKNNAKNYLYVQVSGKHLNPKYSTSTKGVWTFDQVTGAFVTKVSGKTMYLGTYNNFVTISASETWRITGNNASAVDKSQFIARPIILEPHDCQFSEATCSKAPTCSICGKVEGSKLPHTPGPEATCTAAQTCTVCKTTIKAKLAHDYEDGECTMCGAAEPTGLVNATISFANKAQRTEFSTSKQVWVQNGITVTNNKGASTSNVADYANPARFYASSQLIIEGKGMTTIKFTCNSSSYATALKNSIGTISNGTVSVSGSTVTVTFNSAVNSFTIAKLTAQVRVNSITVNP